MAARRLDDADRNWALELQPAAASDRPDYLAIVILPIELQKSGRSRHRWRSRFQAASMLRQVAYPAFAVTARQRQPRWTVDDEASGDPAVRLNIGGSDVEESQAKLPNRVMLAQLVKQDLFEDDGRRINHAARPLSLQ